MEYKNGEKYFKISPDFLKGISKVLLTLFVGILIVSGLFNGNLDILAILQLLMASKLSK
ncbi:hypothetical protein ACSW9G_15305 (plasmid) [Clostridium perfringens]|uniref:hypothetical protein n=1 Tax=Clostridium perfringens TaxID=1502 RepID=UPI002A169B7D|nr:hypothetical protein [Clostridium perfringens]MDK0645788.1 hypothetical protein [Clostridium perfringens]MDM0642661.1 hypothetical protein [Clostridium perfringens]MDM0825069.1 hypothetical protein [Clostridium perfringens]